jgi:hypothetical protein
MTPETLPQLSFKDLLNEGPQFYGSTQTCVVSAHGVLMALMDMAVPKQRLLMQNTESREQQECRLVSGKKELLGPPKVAVEFTRPAPASGTSRFHLPIGLPAFSLAAFRSSSMLDQGVWAEVKVGGEHLRLFSEESALGVQATVYNMNATNWICALRNCGGYRTRKRQSGGTC